MSVCGSGDGRVGGCSNGETAVKTNLRREGGGVKRSWKAAVKQCSRGGVTKVEARAQTFEGRGRGQILSAGTSTIETSCLLIMATGEPSDALDREHATAKE